VAALWAQGVEEAGGKDGGKRQGSKSPKPLVGAQIERKGHGHQP
jgi:hypothetical protein